MFRFRIGSRRGLVVCSRQGPQKWTLCRALTLPLCTNDVTSLGQIVCVTPGNSDNEHVRDLGDCLLQSVFGIDNYAVLKKL